MTDTTPPGPDPAPDPDPSAPPVMPTALPPPPVVSGLRVMMGRYTGPRDMDGQLRLAEQLSKARTALPYRYRDNPGDILALMYHAMALDIELTTAWDNLVFNPEGVGGMRARLMHALLIRAGHHVQPVHADDKMVRMFLRRGDGRPSGGAQWTLAEAIRSGKATATVWVNYGGDMLWARCLSRLARRWAPEVVLGFYAAEELDDIDGADEGLASADMRTAMRDVDGNLVPAPDVVSLLGDAATLNLAELRQLWKRAGEEGVMGAYAGSVDGMQLSVRDLMFDLMSTAEEKEGRVSGPPIPTPATLPGEVVPQDLDTTVDLDAAAADADADADELAADPDVPVADDPVAVEQAPAGTPGKLECGCWAEAVLAIGRHEPDCQREPGQP